MNDLSTAAWRTSSFSNGTGACVEVGLLADGRTAVRNSNHPDVGVVLFTRAEMDAYLKGVKAGEFDDLALRDLTLHDGGVGPTPWWRLSRDTPKDFTAVGRF